jgi:Anti-sigma-K factor rskA
VNGAYASVIITPENEATLVVRSLPPAPAGKTYEAWVIQGNKPAPAGTFAGGGRVAFALTRKVPDWGNRRRHARAGGGSRTPDDQPALRQ